MAVLKPRPLSTAMFMWHPGEQRFTAELSDLTPGRGFTLFGQVYDDACDEGLTLVSNSSGFEVVCAIQHEEKDAEGDLLWIDLVPVYWPSAMARPAWSVRLFND